MPVPALAGPIIGAASNFIGAQQNAMNQQQQNYADQHFTLQMYEQQKKDALDFWNLQNDYNSPAAQMKRFQEAGLNPNLIYGQGNNGNSGPVSTPDYHQVSRRAPEFGNAISGAGMAFINSLYDLDIKQAQANNLREQTNVIHQDALLKASMIGATDARKNRDLFQLGLDQSPEFGSAQFAQERLRQLRNNIDISTQENVRRAALTSSSLRQAASKLLNDKEYRLHSSVDRERMKQSIKLMEKEGVLKDFDIELSRSGMTRNDALWQRLLAPLLQKMISGEVNLKSMMGNTGSILGDYFTPDFSRLKPSLGEGSRRTLSSLSKDFMK